MEAHAKTVYGDVVGAATRGCCRFLGIPFAKGFFVSPVMETTWILVVAKDDYSILSLEFAPAPVVLGTALVGRPPTLWLTTAHRRPPRSAVDESGR